MPTTLEMAPKKKPADEADDRTTIKVSKAIYRKLTVIAAHKEMSASALADMVLGAYVEDEYPKTGDEIKKGN